MMLLLLLLLRCYILFYPMLLPCSPKLLTIINYVLSLKYTHIPNTTQLPNYPTTRLSRLVQY